MHVGYLTTDEVNQELACGFAERLGFTLDPLWPKDGPWDGEFDAVVYDLDSLPRETRDEICAKLVSGYFPYPVSVHSYNLDDQQMEALRENGVAVFQRLEPEVFVLMAILANRKINAAYRSG